MSTDLTTIDQKEANEFLTDTIFDYFDMMGYLRIIYGTNGQIPGFSMKNANKAPISLIKNIAKQRVRKISDATSFLSDYIKKLKKDFEGLSFHEFYAKISIDEKLSDGEKLALFFLLYHEDYQENANKIQENINHKLPPLSNLLSLSLTEKMKSLHAVGKSHEFLDETDFNEFFELDESVIPDDEENLKEKLKKNPLPPTDEGKYLTLYKYFLEEADEWEDDEKVGFLQLVLGDLFSFLQFVADVRKEEKQELEEKLEEKEKAYDELKETSKTQLKKISSLENKLDLYKDELDDLVLKYGLLSNRNEGQMKEIKRLSDLNQTYLKNIEKLRSEKAKMKLEHQETKPENVYLFENEKLYFITKAKSDKFPIFFTDDQMIHLSEGDDLNEILEGKEEDAIYFFNVDGISTRESFKLERPLKTNNLTYRLVSGGIENIIRKIIYYLEGELRDEVKEKH